MGASRALEAVYADTEGGGVSRVSLRDDSLCLVGNREVIIPTAEKLTAEAAPLWKMSDLDSLPFMKSKQIKITFVEHKTARSVVLGFFRNDHPRLSDEKILKTKTVFEVLLGTPIHDAKVEQVLEVVKTVGCWGYCKHLSKNEKEIHYWVKKNMDHVKIIELFAHEIGHAFGYSNETTAQRIGAAAALSFTTYRDKYAKKVLNDS